ncbi:MAG: class II aldolase/adducin family protein [Clostridia bacterium]|nr:class II aldolase/adducin family protein [Clostridia bacterium]MBO4517922.1 class II aldolase/adducin family protein [Clostridia bacterium]
MNFNLMHPAEQIVLLLSRVYQKGLTTTSGGNLSIKDSEGVIWITPSGIDKGSLTAADICKVLPDGTVIGKYKPSVELPFHKLVYETRPDVSAVLHAHPPALVSYSLIRKIPDINIVPTPSEVCGKVGIAKYEVPGSDALANRIVEEIKKGLNVVIMENHGVITCADNLFEAFKRFETLNFAASIGITASTIGTPVSLTKDQLKIYSTKGKNVLGEFIPSEFSSDERRLRKEMCALIHRSYDQGLFTSTQGTFSVRLDKHTFLITPYGVDRKYIEPEDIVRIEYNWREAGKNPSRSVELHKLIYDEHPEINAITVAQPKYIMAFGATHTPLDSRTIPESYIAMRDIAVLPFGTNITDPKRLSAAISVHSPVVLIQNDSVISTGNTLINAFDRLEVAEFTANTVIHAKMIGDIVMISDNEVSDINKAFHLD